MSSSTIRHRLPDSFPDYIRRCFTIDSRSLAIFRIAVALLIIADVILRSRNFYFYYTDDGVVPQDLAELYRREAFSFFFYTSDPTLIAGLFVFGVVIAIALLIGYKTRIATILSFLFVISLDHHNPLVLSYADTLFRMLLFWAIFLPLGERWSIDAIQRSRPSRPAVVSWATAAIMIQMVYMYFVNAMNKFPSPLWHSGEAAIIVMGIDEMTFLIGNFTRNFPTLLQIGGFTWFHIMLLSPLLILLYGRARYPQLLLFMGGHASFAITVRIGAFAYVAIAGLLIFLQPRFWRDVSILINRLGLATGIRRTRTTVYSSGKRLAALLPGRIIDFPSRDTVAHVTLSVLVIIAMIGLFVLPSFAMAADGPYLDENPIPGENPVEDFTAKFGVTQPPWSIFAGPGPRSVDRYYVFPAQTADGDVIDIYNDRPMTYDRPGQHLQHQHYTYRERFFMNSIRRSGSTGTAAQLYAEHLCQTWADDRGVELTHINMYEVRERITLQTIDDPDNREREINLMSRHSCGDDGPIDIMPPDENDLTPPAQRD